MENRRGKSGFSFLGLQNHCGQWLQSWCFLLGMKAMTNVGSILKSRDINLLTKVCIVKATVFPVVMYGCESWTIKKAECQGSDAFELQCWRRLLRVPWTASKSKQPILKEISPEYSLEGLMLKLKFQYSGHLIWRADSLEKTLMLGKIEGKRRRGQRIMVRWHHWLNGHEFEQIQGDGEGQGSLEWCSSCSSQTVGHNLATEQWEDRQEAWGLSPESKCTSTHI